MPNRAIRNPQDLPDVATFSTQKPECPCVKTQRPDSCGHCHHALTNCQDFPASPRTASESVSYCRRSVYRTPARALEVPRTVDQNTCRRQSVRRANLEIGILVRASNDMQFGADNLSNALPEANSDPVYGKHADSAASEMSPPSHGSKGTGPVAGKSRFSAAFPVNFWRHGRRPVLRVPSSSARHPIPGRSMHERNHSPSAVRHEHWQPIRSC